MDKRYILAIEFEGEMGIRVFPDMQGVWDHLKLEIESFLNDPETEVQINNMEDVMYWINDEGVPLNFTTLDLMEAT